MSVGFLLVTLLVVALAGFVVWLVTTKIPMPDGWPIVIQVVALIVMLLWVFERFGWLDGTL